MDASTSSSPSPGTSMPPLVAKTMAAATGATVTALTMTPFDVIKTRLQTQPIDAPPSGPSSSSGGLGMRGGSGSVTCCQPGNVPCVRQYSTMTFSPSTSTQLDFRERTPRVVCVWDSKGVLHNERVTGFWDAAFKVWRMEGVKGLWKGVGTTLVIAVPSQTVYMVTYDTLRKSMAMPHPDLAAWTPLVAGIAARTLVSSLSSPLELFRTRLQATPADPTKPHTARSVASGVFKMVRRQGPMSLYKGLGPTLWRDVPFSGLYWAGFELLKKRLKARGHQGTTVTFVSGAVSGTVAAMLTSPFDVLKTRRQALLQAVSSLPGSPQKHATATIPLIRQIVRTEGVKALYAGLTPRIAKIAPACGIMISCYEGVERYFDVRMLD